MRVALSIEDTALTEVRNLNLNANTAKYAGDVDGERYFRERALTHLLNSIIGG